MAEKTALRPQAAIGPVVRAVAESILARARTAMTDSERDSQKAVHEFRRTTKQWRALMRLLAPFVPDAPRLRQEARTHARALSHARDGAAARLAFDDLLDKGMVVLSERASETIRARIDALRGRKEVAVLTPARRTAIVTWLDRTSIAVAQWPLDAFTFSGIAAQLTESYRRARRRVPADWMAASAEELHTLRQRVVDLRYQMDLIEPLWPRFGQMWTEEAERLRNRLGRCQDIEVLRRLTAPHQPLAHWRSRLLQACDDRSIAVAQRAARIAARLFSERPKAFRHRLETLWDEAP
jgi:CHAD domain-containing protein